MFSFSCIRRLTTVASGLTSRVSTLNTPMALSAYSSASSALTKNLRMMSIPIHTSHIHAKWSSFSNSISMNSLVPPNPTVIPVRTITKYSLRHGKRKTVKAVLKRFYRLDWGIWIHAKCGKHKKMWKKSSARRRRLRQHVFSNATQSRLLDKMVMKFWRKPHHYVDDIYAPYHTREEFPFTRKKPIGT